jgi:hypothetical protein
MRARALSVVVLVVLGGLGCKESESAPRAVVVGGDLVRGVSGVSDKSDAKLAAVADDVVDAIEAGHPKRLATIKADLESGDADRVVAAKILLDETIAEVAARLADPANASGVHTLDAPLVGGSSGTALVDAGQQLLCEQPTGSDGKPLHLGSAGGAYGDGRTGVGAAAGDTTDLVDGNGINVFTTLRRVDSGELVPDPDSRLGAYAATRGYAPGTVGNSVHNAIGTIFVTFANYGQERIGRVFNSPEARALYDKPVASCAGRQMALLEYQYWRDVAAEDPWSPGGRMGSMFNPAVRDLLQRQVFDR